MSGFVWLASYPKSGNTWIRAFLTSVGRDGGAVDINSMDAVTQPSARRFLDEMLGIATVDLTNEEVLRALPAALHAHRAASTGTTLHKVHEAWIRNGDLQPLFPSELTQASIYIVRDPRDVAVSFAHHLGKSIDHTIDLMNDPEAALGVSTARFTDNITQRLGSWSQHVESWLDRARPVPLVARYEDMLAFPAQQGALIARHIGLDKDVAVYEQAAKSSGFEELSGQESRNGFREILAPGRRFFRAGTVGGWRTELGPAQAARVERDHGHVMHRLNYLP